MNRILHLGLGRFHRGHQAVYYQKSGGWKVTASTMRSPDERDKLREVKLRYPVLELTYDSENLTWIDCIDEVLSLHEDIKRLYEVFASPETKIVTVTVTEKGYCLDQAGQLDVAHHLGIQHDLISRKPPETLIGFLAYGLQLRKEPLTIISCDNLSGNGQKLESAVMQFLSLKSDITDIEKRVSFPNTMVDRIVPALLPEKVAELEARHRLGKSELIATEKFSQWVIEDKFMGERPNWTGVEFVKDVKPYEEMKLRLLNASHSYLAYAGLNRGYQFVHEAIHDETLNSNVMNMLTHEVIPLLPVPTGFDVDSYVDQLMSRFRNYKLPHQLKQIAMDGSQKMPQRIFSSLIEAKHKNKSHALLLQAADEWMEFLWSFREKKIDDPKAADLLREINLGKDKWKSNLMEKFTV